MGLNSPFVRLGIAAAVILMIFSIPAREFLKLTFMLGIPFVLFLSLAAKKRKYSPVWVVSVMGLFVVVGGYVYMLGDLPERIETRKIISEGAVLVAEGKYDQAINCYRQLEKLNRSEKMEKKIAEADKEKKASILLAEARALMQNGNESEAIKKIQSIPEGTRAKREASRILKELKE